MFGDQPLNFTVVAAVAIPQYHIVLGSGENYGGLAGAGLGAALIGVCQGAPQAGEFATVCPLGKSRVVVGSAVTAYQKITSTASGRACPTVSGDTIVGMALQAGAVGDVVMAMLYPPSII